MYDIKAEMNAFSAMQNLDELIYASVEFAKFDGLRYTGLVFHLIVKSIFLNFYQNYSA